MARKFKKKINNILQGLVLPHFIISEGISSLYTLVYYSHDLITEGKKQVVIEML